MTPEAKEEEAGKSSPSSNPHWNNSGSNPSAPIVLGGGFPNQPQRSTAAPAPPAQWQGSAAPGWNAPQPAPEQLGWGQKSVQSAEPASGNLASNPFAALKGTVEEPKPVNPFNALMSHQSLPQQPMPEQPKQEPPKPESPKPEPPKPEPPKLEMPKPELPGSSMSEAQDPSANPYDALTNSGAGIKQAPSNQPPPPPKSAAPFTSSNPVIPVLPQSVSSTSNKAIQSNQGPLINQAGHAHPRVPDFAAMTSSGAYPAVSVNQDQALNPKGQVNYNQNKAPSVVNQVSAPANQKNNSNSSPTGAANQPTPAKSAPPSTPQSSAPAKPLPAPVDLDRAAVDAVFKSLSNPETGLLNQGSLLFFLVREFSRFQVNNEPFSLIIMEMNVIIQGSVGAQLPRPLPPRGIRAAAQKIFSITRQLDLVAHYDQTDYAILLPATSRQQAADFAQSVSKTLLLQPLLPDMEPKSLIVRIGVASFPEDTSHPGILLAAARDAKMAAVQREKPVMLFADT